jgi:hypothetical protein
MDSLLNPMASPVSLWFIVDYTPPVLLSHIRGYGGVVEELAPLICANITDYLSGIDVSSLIIDVDGILYSPGDLGTTWDGTSLCFNPSIAGISWAGGDSVIVRIIAGDSPDHCAPNVLDSVFVFEISAGGPVPNVIRPVNGAIVACNPDSVHWAVRDTNGIIYESARGFVVRFNTTGTRDSTALSLGSGFTATAETRTRGRIILNPGSDFFTDGDSVFTCLTALTDSLLNPLASPSCVRFLVDRSAPLTECLHRQMVPLLQPIHRLYPLP